MSDLPEIGGSVLWLEPDPSRASHFRKWIMRLSEKYNSPLFDPHITLSRIHDLSPETVKLNLEKIAAQQSAFILNTFSAECREKPYQKIVVPVHENHSLHGLYTTIDEVFGENFSKREDPHLSLLYSNHPCSELREIMRQIYFEPNELHIQYITLVNLDGTPETWKKPFRISLND